LEGPYFFVRRSFSALKNAACLIATGWSNNRPPILWIVEKRKVIYLFVCTWKGILALFYANQTEKEPAVLHCKTQLLETHQIMMLE
jgi:hypothetical protein